MDSSLERTATLRIACTVMLVFSPMMHAQVKQGPITEAEQEPVSFNRDVRPLLSDRCFHCHGQDEHNRKGKLRLDIAGGPHGAYRLGAGTQVIKPGSPDDSELWYRLKTDDESERMPPADSHKEPLNTEELLIVEAWIEQGAEYEDFWAFLQPTQPALPVVENMAWSQQPIDQFVLRKLESMQLRPSPRADKRTLIRRLCFDLTGLPPMPAEIGSFLRDDAPDDYEKLVDRLLAKPQFGEHMAKYWLDLVRFSDTNGLHHDHYREMTPYRDWVIRSFNESLAFDQFISYQVAGDLYAEPSLDQQIASGFNRLHLIIDRGTALPEESFMRNVVDRVSAVGTAFLGLTVQCAVCHDHKYDPITQSDFYSLYAFFNNFDGGAETGGRSGTDFERGLQPPYINLPDDEQAVMLERLQLEIGQTEAEIARLRGKFGEAVGEEREQALSETLKPSMTRLETLRKEQGDVLRAVPAALVMRERAHTRPAHIKIRGQYDREGDVVERATPAFLPPMAKSGESLRTRMDLADWLVARSNPLTARVATNRFWQHLFGVGLVKTSEDFGVQGELPSHPDLLDHLTLAFVDSGWDVKQLMRSIVVSETYKQTSHASPTAFAFDPENRALARGSRFRLDSEMLRDHVLSVGNLLSSEMFGKSVKPPQPPGLWEAVAMPHSYPKVFEPDSGDDVYRRSVYTFWKRAMPPPQMTIFDAPTREACIARRERTNTPLQALLLMNERQFFHAAGNCAKTLLAIPGLNDSERLRLAFERASSQLPSARRLEILKHGLDTFRGLYAGDAGSALAMTEGKAADNATPEQRAELAAWTMLVHSLLNLDVCKTRQ
ncbi:MAG: hypothetical protein ACI841_001277 [Planctomycetota bacterium]|jgi:hypothetical protein